MDFIEFVIEEYNRPFVTVRLVCDEDQYYRGNYVYRINNHNIQCVESAAIFEFAPSTLFLHGNEENFTNESRRTQSASVRSFLGYNTARVITNNYMKRVNP